MQWTLTQTSSFTQITAGALFLRCSSGQQKLQPLLDRFALTPRRPGRSPTIRAFHGAASWRGRQPTATTRRRVTLAWLRSVVPARRCKPTWSLRRAVAKARAMELPGLALRIRVLWARSIGSYYGRLREDSASGNRPDSPIRSSSSCHRAANPLRTPAAPIAYRCIGTAETGACSAASAGEAKTPTQSGSGCRAGRGPRGGLSGDQFGVPG